MTTPYLGEIRMFAGNFAIKNWAFCNGQTLAIQQNAALFSLLGTTFGGNGVSTFQLPNLQGRLPVGQGQGLGLSSYVVGQIAGVETVTLLQTNLPTHNHQLNATTANATLTAINATDLPGTITTPTSGRYYVQNTGSPAPTFGTMNPQTVGMSGGNQPHSNLMPALCVSFIIALYGVYPTRN